MKHRQVKQALAFVVAGCGMQFLSSYHGVLWEMKWQKCVRLLSPLLASHVWAQSGPCGPEMQPWGSCPMLAQHDETQKEPAGRFREHSTWGKVAR
eukprot:5387873-Amphidinium_carterae.1